MVEGGHFSDREIKKENKKKVRGKDMTKFFVKKPYFVLVTVIIVLVMVLSVSVRCRQIFCRKWNFHTWL